MTDDRRQAFLRWCRDGREARRQGRGREWARANDPLGQLLTEDEANALADEMERENRERGIPPLRIGKPGEKAAAVAAAGGWEEYQKRLRK